MNNLEPKNNKQPSFGKDISILAVIIITGIVVFGLVINGKFKKEEQLESYRQEQYQEYKEQRYYELVDRFKEPQKVVARYSYALIPDNNFLIITNAYHSENYTDQENKKHIFDNYAESNLIGQYVDIIMPTKELFLSGLYNRDDEDNQETMPAEIYFNGESLNNKFDILNPSNGDYDYYLQYPLL